MASVQISTDPDALYKNRISFNTMRKDKGMSPIKVSERPGGHVTIRISDIYNDFDADSYVSPVSDISFDLITADATFNS